MAHDTHTFYSQIFFQLTLNNSYGPLFTALPLSLSDRMAASPVPDRPEAKRMDRVEVDEEAAVGTSSAGSGDYEEFTHPAVLEDQQVVWIPRDTLGLGDAEVAANNAQGVQSSLAGAQMDGKGHVAIDGPPPGEDVHGM